MILIMKTRNNRSKRQVQYLLPLNIVLLVLFLACSGCDTTSSKSESENQESNPSAELDCERLGYPCSLSEMPDNIYQATKDALNGVYEVRDNGTMNDVLTYLKKLPNMAEAELIDNAIRFRLEGGTPTFFLDISTEASPQEISIGFKQDDDIPTSNSIVGEDQNNDNKINNRDHRRGLVLAPYRWQFHPNDESRLIRDRLYFTPGYLGNVDYEENLNSLFDKKITLDHFYHWDNYDTIFIATHGKEYCWLINFGRTRKCGVIISTGVLVDEVDNSTSTGPTSTGAYLHGLYEDTDTEASDRFFVYMLTTDFFRAAYPSGLDNTLLVFSACQAGSDFGDDGADDVTKILGGKNFVMMGWSDFVPSPIAGAASLLVMDALKLGLAAKKALNKVKEQNISPWTYFSPEKQKEITTEFIHFAPKGGDQRIREIIALVDDNGLLQDGQGLLADRINGTDHLDLTVKVDGVLPDEKNDYKVWIELDGESLGESKTLSNAQQVDEYSYNLSFDDLDTGRIIDSEVNLEAIVELPEGGESRYEVMVQAVSCYFNAKVSEDASGEWNGPARFFNGIDGEVTIILNEGTSEDFGAYISATTDLNANGNIINGDYPVAYTSVEQDDVFLAVYDPGWPDTDCDQCGGIFRVSNSTYSEYGTSSISGEFNVTLPGDLYHEEPGYGFFKVEGVFTAVYGSELDSTSAYGRCLKTYKED